MVIGIYLYTSSGTIDVTATYSCYDNHVYDPDGHLVGVVDAYNQIEDANNKAVGYVGSGIGNP